jgi:hypothetical protein
MFSNPPAPVFNGSQAPPMNPHQAPAPAKQYAQGTQNVPIVNTNHDVKPSGWADISDYHDVMDWFYIIVGVLLIEVFVIFLTRYFPDLLGKSLNIWYNRFKLSAVIADILIILVGFAIARYVYTEYIYPNFDWNPTYFTGTVVGTQVIHDILFYFGIIKPIDRGSNAMMDVFKDYAESGGAKIIAGDSGMMLGSTLLSILLKSIPAHGVVAIGLLGAYAVPYLLEKRNEFSGIS